MTRMLFRSFDPQVLINRLGSGSGVTESGDEALLALLFNFEEISGAGETKTNVIISENVNDSSIFNKEPESSGDISRNRTDTRLLIPEACHYWDHSIGWKIFILFNFLIMFLLPFFVSFLYLCFHTTYFCTTHMVVKFIKLTRRDLKVIFFSQR